MKVNIKLFFSLALVVALFGAGCLKDTDFNNGSIQSIHTLGTTPKVIEIKLTANNSTEFYIQSVDAIANDTIINFIPINLASADVAPTDIHVTVTRNDSLVNNYDTAHGTTYAIAPDSLYRVINPSAGTNSYIVTIPKGQHTGYLQVGFTPTNFIATNYAFGYSITGVAESGYTISGNNQNGVVALGIKNKYDGNYQLTQETIGWAAYGIADGATYTWPKNGSNSIWMETAGVSSVNLFDDVAFGSVIQPAFTTSGGITGFGSTAPQYVFDPVTNALTNVINLAYPNSRGRNFHLNPAVTDSRYDPATKTIYAAYIMVQIGRPDQQIYDTLVYLGPRP